MSTQQTIQYPSFFVTGGTIPRDALSYVVRAADERLYSSLCRGDICYALTPRQMGKSSLMVRTAARLRERKTSVAVLDLTAFGQNLTPDQWYNGLLGRIGQQLDLEDHLEDYWAAHLHLGSFHRWAGAIRDVVLTQKTGRVVVFIDEIDAVRSLPFSTDEFFAGIREFFNRRTQDPELARLTFCLLGVATPSDLIRDTRTTPFNVGVRVELSDFSEAEAAPLAQGLCVHAETGQLLLRRILYWTGGHPYLTQRLCQAVAEDRAMTAADVDRVCGALFLSHRARERDDNLLFVRERLLRNETDVAGLLLLYGKVRNGSNVRDEETNPLVTILRLSGIVRVEQGSLRVRNRIYGEVFDKTWVTENLPGAELRRQRTAYRRGLRIASAAFASLVLLTAGWRLYRLFSVDVRPPRVGRLLTAPGPPAFWASFASQTLSASASGSLLIRAGDADISVFINGAQYGRTDKTGTLQIPVLPAADYDVRLEKVGFQGLSQRVQVAAQQELRLTFKLSPVSQAVIENELHIAGAPASTRVTIDGKLAGTTNAAGDLTVNITPGEHEVTLDHPGYLVHSFRMSASPGFNLVDGKLQIDTEASDLDAALHSNDPSALQDYLARHASSPQAHLVRDRLEDLEWAKYRDCNDPTVLQGFLDKYPSGHHIAEANALAARLAQEDIEWRQAQSTNSPEAFQIFMEKHPQSRHLADAQQMVTLSRDRTDILQVLQDYQNAFNRQDLSRVVQLWPRFPVDALGPRFKEKKSGVLTLSPKGIPDVKGSVAVLTVERTRVTESANTSGSVPFTFRKQGDRWVIENGAF